MTETEARGSSMFTCKFWTTITQIWVGFTGAVAVGSAVAGLTLAQIDRLAVPEPFQLLWAFFGILAMCPAVIAMGVGAWWITAEIVRYNPIARWYLLSAGVLSGAFLAWGVVLAGVIVDIAVDASMDHLLGAGAIIALAATLVAFGSILTLMLIQGISELCQDEA